MTEIKGDPSFRILKMFLMGPLPAYLFFRLFFLLILLINMLRCSQRITITVFYLEILKHNCALLNRVKVVVIAGECYLSCRWHFTKKRKRKRFPNKKK